MRNLAELVCDRARRRPDVRFGMAGDAVPTLAEATALAMGAVGTLEDSGAGLGRRVALIGATSNTYLVAWLALVLSGAEVALVNPDYPDELLAEMLEQLRPDAVVWSDREATESVAPGAAHLDAAGLEAREPAAAGATEALTAGAQAPQAALPGPAALASAPGLGRDRFDTAGWMHTSGTTGVPKFCEQTHEYFLRLGRFIADSMCLSPADTVLAPLPMFHINPLGYGVVGGLTGGAEVLGLERFSARGFWPVVRDSGATVLILHAPPVEILKRATTAADAAGHRVSRVFFADPDFLETFDVPLGFSAYGSTEAGGLSHIWTWRKGERPGLAEGMSRYGGRARHDLQWRVSGRQESDAKRTPSAGNADSTGGTDGMGSTDSTGNADSTDSTDSAGNADSTGGTSSTGSTPGVGEIEVRAERPGVLFAGYRTADRLVRPFDDEGWFATGDLGRIDEAGNLVFIERRSESIRVKGEFVPIGFLEQRFAAVGGITDTAVWRRDSDLVDDEIVLYMTGGSIPTEAIRATSAALPAFMRPSEVALVAEIPRDSGVGKVRRRLLAAAPVLQRADLRDGHRKGGGVDDDAGTPTTAPVLERADLRHGHGSNDGSGRARP